MSVFLNVDTARIAELIDSAQSKVVYAAPGLFEEVAKALICAVGRIGVGNVSVMLDITEIAFRIGYGNIAGVNLLTEHKIAIRDADGIRIGVLVHDDEGLIFTSPPLAVEDGQEEACQPNAIKAAPAQVRNIVAATTWPQDSENLNTTETHEPEIGAKEVGDGKIKEVTAKIKENPPPKFDVTRSVAVLDSKVQYVEIKLYKVAIERRTISIPSELLVEGIDEDMKERLKTKFNVIQKGSDFSGKEITDMVDDLRNHHTHKIPKHGSLILQSEKYEFNQEIELIRGKLEKFKHEVKHKLRKETEKTCGILVEYLTPNVMKNPPKQLITQSRSSNPTEEKVKTYLNNHIDKTLRAVEKTIEGMRIECIFKGITHESIADKEFQSYVKEAFPLDDWDKMFETYGAARER